MVACDHYDVQPDMITFAKGVTGGYLPLGGVILSKELSTYYDDNVFLSGATYSGHTLVCEIGNAAIKSYEDMDLIKHVKQMEIVMNERLEKLRVYKYVGDVRNKGLFGAVEFGSLCLIRDFQITSSVFFPSSILTRRHSTGHVACNVSIFTQFYT